MVSAKNIRRFTTVFSFAVMLLFSLTKIWQSFNDIQVLGQKDDRGYELARVERVVDGDTIELTDGRRIRYIGINTPETKDPRKEVECYGQEAAEFNRQLVENKIVYLEKDVQDIDPFGRVLRYVWLENEMINHKLVAEGYAYSATYTPNVKHQEQLKQAQKEARLSDKGLWSKCESKK